MLKSQAIKVFSFLIASFAAGMFLYSQSTLMEETKTEEVKTASKPEQEPSEPYPVPFGLPPIPWPKDNPYTKEKANLGRMLYFDKRLSSDGTISCASCHGMSYAFTDKTPVSEGIHGRKGNRHSPTIINTAYQTHQFWDGRAATLEEQCKGPLTNPNEMTLNPTAALAMLECEDRINLIPEYREMFKAAFNDDRCSIDHIAMAIATFERTILSGNSRYDHYLAGDQTALTPEEIEGLQVFRQAGCNNCHLGPNFTNGSFMNIGIGMDDEKPDLGRYEVTKNENDWGSFKIPTLREASLRPFFMHDGSLNSLEEVVDYYDKGGIPNRNLSPLMVPLHLTPKDKKALVAFLKSLNGEGWRQSVYGSQD